MDTSGVIQVVRAMARQMAENKELLTSLDAAIGDADHGINMDKGFRAVLARLDGQPATDVGQLLRTTGMALLSTVGGAAGPLYGTAFMRAGQAVAGRQEVGLPDLVAMLEAAIDGIKQRGKAVRGEKTMLDALEPALDALRAAAGQGKDTAAALADAVAAARAGVEFTKTIKATKGRASYLGDRSIGHQDPGATSSTLLLQAIHHVVGG